MCHAITKSGKRCKINTANHFCHIHDTATVDEDVTAFFFFRDLMREAHSEIFNEQDYTCGIKGIWPNRDYQGYPFAKNDPEKKQTLNDLRILHKILANLYN